MKIYANIRKVDEDTNELKKLDENQLNSLKENGRFLQTLCSAILKTTKLNFMKIKLKTKLEDQRAKVEMAQFLSRIISGQDYGEALPYRKHEDDDNSWTLDAANNWWLHIDSQDASLIDIDYRYNHAENDAENRLFGWLDFRMNGIEKV